MSSGPKSAGTETTKKPNSVAKEVFSSVSLVPLVPLVPLVLLVSVSVAFTLVIDRNRNSSLPEIGDPISEAKLSLRLSGDLKVQ